MAQLPILPELDALKNDYAILEQCYGHLKGSKNSDEFLEAYKYSFSRKGNIFEGDR